MNALPTPGAAQPPPLDPGFQPAVLARRRFAAAVTASGRPQPVQFALEQADGSVMRFDTDVLPEGHPAVAGNRRHVERLVKFMLWSRGGFRLHVAGPRALGEYLTDHFARTPTGRFDAQIMGERIYDRPFEVLLSDIASLPAARESTRPLGRHLDGCRIGFDLGASDVKVAASHDGRPVFSEEYPWAPVGEADPSFHFNFIMNVLKEAARHLPRVDGIGGSSAGVYVNNRVKVASLFRAVPPDVFQARVKDFFLEMQRAWGGIPFDVVNDGEVTALAGSMSFNDTSVLGIAMGSSEATGYVTPEGNITSWLNELAFAPVDDRIDGPVDEWSGDRGCGVQYFSQQGVGRLLPAAGIETEPGLGLPEKLKFVQYLMAKDDPRARKIYETVGCYLGYTIAHYADFYTIRNVLVLGRVTSGAGGAILMEVAQDVLNKEFPELAARLQLRTPDERDKRHGQAIAAASLPVIT
jgi:predicted NBD/HSP70 family sugar kinase